MQALLWTMLIAAASGLKVFFTLTNLHRYGSRETVVALMSTFDLESKNVAIICRILASREYNLHSIYEEITESIDRTALLSNLYKDQTLHDSLFSVRKLIHNHHLARLVLLRSLTTYQGNLVSHKSATAVNVSRQYGFPEVLRGYMMHVAVNTQMGKIETLDWLTEYLQEVDIKSALSVVAFFKPHEVTPHVVQVFLDQFGKDATFLNLFLRDEDNSTMNVLKKLMVIRVAARLSNQDLSPCQRFVEIGQWKQIRGVRLFYGKREISGESLYSFAMNEMKSENYSLRQEAMDALCFWGLDARDRSYWGMLAGLVELGEGDISWFFQNVRRESVAPMTFLSLCQQFVAECQKYIPKFWSWPDEYLPYDLLPLNKVVQEWMRGGQFTILQANEMHYLELAEAEREIIDYSLHPWNGHVIGEREATWIGDALIAKLQYVLLSPGLVSNSLLMCMALTIPYLIVCNKKLDFSRPFQNLPHNASWDQFYRHLDWTVSSEIEVKSFIAQMEDLTEYFTFAAVRVLVDSSYQYR